MSSGLDAEYWHAILSAADALRKFGAELRKESSGRTAALINYLRSGKTLEHAERQELADLIAGEFGRRPGRPEVLREQKQWRVEVCERVFILEKNWREAGQKWPFRSRAAREVSLSLLTEPRERRATAEQIERWMNGLPKSTRDRFRQKFGG